MQDNKFSTLKEVYEALEDSLCMVTFDNVEMCIKDHGIPCMLSIVKESNEYIFFTKHGRVNPDIQQQEYLDCIYFGNGVRYFPKVMRPIPDINATVGFFNI